MKKRATVLVGLILLGCAAASAAEAEASFFRLDFVVKEVDEGRVVNARNYSAVISTSRLGAFPQSVRTGSKVPVNASGSPYTYIDVGVNFDCNRVVLNGNQLAFDLTADLSSFAEGSKDGAPVIRQNRWQSMVTIPLRKPTMVFSSDDLTSKRKTQVELTATPVAP
jgi:hypothetical protein